MRVSLLALTAALVLTAGCAVRPQQPVAPVEPWEEEHARQPFECRGASECATAWRAAQAWIAMNAAYKIQVASDAVVQTYNARDYSTGWAFQLTRMPVGNGAERFELVPSCGAVSLCELPSWRMRAKFNRAMREAVGRLASSADAKT